MCNSGMGTTTYFTKATKKENRKNKSGEKQKKYCTHCKICGHDTSECWKLKKEQEAKGTANVASPSITTLNTAASAKVATVAANEEVVCTIHLFQAKTESPEQLDFQQHWIINSSASHTMCSNHHWF
jgi:hypothetical protein